MRHLEREYSETWNEYCRNSVKTNAKFHREVFHFADKFAEIFQLFGIKAIETIANFKHPKAHRDFHDGKIKVQMSEIDVGTTMLISLKTV